jgi:hypothetical protein
MTANNAKDASLLYKLLVFGDKNENTIKTWFNEIIFA